MADNEAARANFEELKGHIELASKRIRALQPGTDSYNQSLEDLEDYYERTVQLRKMQADTAIEERNQIKSYVTTITLFSFLTVVMFAAIVAQFSKLDPDTFQQVWSMLRPFVTIDRFILALVILIVVKKNTKA